MKDRNKKTTSQEQAAPAAARKGARRALAVLLACLIAAACVLVGWLAALYSRDARLRKLEWLIQTLGDEYYREADLDALYEELYDMVVPDEFSAYYSAEEYAQKAAESEGAGTGIGVTVAAAEGGLRIHAVTENSPACLAGLKEGMYLLGWEGGGGVQTGELASFVQFVGVQSGAFVLYADFSPDALPSAENAFSLEKRTFRAAYCLYRDAEASFGFRGEEETSLTETGGGLAGLGADTAYIALKRFNGNCAEEFEACLALMRSRGKKHLILDLRGNGGGYLSDLQCIAAHLLRNAEGARPVVARAKFRSGAETVYRAAGNDFSAYFSAESRIYVLADENSASASECLIGALVDYGTLGYDHIFLRRDGETGVCRTYGKGVMQSAFEYSDGSAFRLTVAEIVWPQGKSIHGRGVTPEDGAVAVTAPAFAGEQDLFLEEVLALLG